MLYSSLEVVLTKRDYVITWYVYAPLALSTIIHFFKNYCSPQVLCMFPNYAVYNHQSAKIITLSGLLIKAATLDLAPENKTMISLLRLLLSCFCCLILSPVLKGEMTQSLIFIIQIFLSLFVETIIFGYVICDVSDQFK